MSGILLARRSGGFKTGIVLPNVGDAWLGGYYVGIIDTTKGNIIATDASQVGLRHALIVSPKSLETTSAYKTTGDAAPSAARTRWNGLAATQAMNSSTYPAAKYCLDLTYPADAASQWYLPAMDELEMLYRAFKPTTDSNYTTSVAGGDFPGGTVYAGTNPSSDPTGPAYTTSNPARTSLAAFQSAGVQAMELSFYFSSTEYSSIYAWRQDFTYAGTQGRQQLGSKTQTNYGVRPVRRLVLT